VTSSDWGGRRYPPYAFTEQGVAMLSSVLHNQRAIQVNIEIMRTYIRLRKILASHVELARKLTALEKKYDAQFKEVFRYSSANGTTRTETTHHWVSKNQRMI
jgi:hypothetical protein